MDATLRFFASHCLSGQMPIYVVNEYPRSGGTWFGLMLADYLNIPFQRNRAPRLGAQVIHAHYLYSPFLKNVFCIFRDGRDIMVSLYYYSLFFDGLDNQQNVKHTKKYLGIIDPNNIEENLPKFIEYKFSRKNSPRFNWTEFVDDWVEKDIPKLFYENLLSEPLKTISLIFENAFKKEVELVKLEKIVEKYRFRNLTGRETGQQDENSFFRKGIAGDWKNTFSPEARQIFNHYAGQQLIQLGYEKNEGWVEQGNKNNDGEK